MTGPPLPDSAATRRRDGNSAVTTAGHRSDGQRPPQSDGADTGSTVRHARRSARRKALQSAERRRFAGRTDDLRRRIAGRRRRTAAGAATATGDRGDGSVTGHQRPRLRLSHRRPATAATAQRPATAATRPATALGGSATDDRRDRSVTGDGGDECRDVLRILAVGEPRGHLAAALRASLLDRVQDERLLALGIEAADELVEVRPDLSDGVRRRQRVTRRAALGEDVAPALLGRSSA